MSERYASPPPSYKSVPVPYYSCHISDSQHHSQGHVTTYETCSSSSSTRWVLTESNNDNLESSPLLSAWKRPCRDLCFVRGYMGIIVVLALAFVLGLQNTGNMALLVDDIPAAEKAAIRHQWQVEQAAVRREMEETARVLREMREAYEQEKEEWARRRHEEEVHRKEFEWRRRGAHWSEPWAASWKCSGYGTRPYSAYLLDLPGDIDNWHEACMDIPIHINGRWVEHPDKCEKDRHNTWATWYIDFGEPQCVTYWDPMRDMGCSPGRSGMRRYESRLMNLRHGDDWDIMCRTTPANISGVYFDQPNSCEQKNGRTGMFDVPSNWC